MKIRTYQHVVQPHQLWVGRVFCVKVAVAAKFEKNYNFFFQGTTKLNSIFNNVIQGKIQQDLCSYKMQQNILPNCPKLGALDLGQHCNGNVSKDALKILSN